MKNIRQLLDTFDTNQDLIKIHTPVDPYLELAEIHRRVVQDGGPALLFTQVKNSPFPVATNLFGTPTRVEQAFGSSPMQCIEDLVELATTAFPPTFSTLYSKRHTLLRLTHVGTKTRARAPVAQVDATSEGLTPLPMLTSWPQDGGPFLTLPLVYTQSPHHTPPNLGMYRIQRFDSHTAGLHFQIGKGGGFHLEQAEQLSQPLPVSIFLGGPPALILAAIAPLPENVPELLLASLVQNEKLALSHTKKHPHPLINECEFAIQGIAQPHQRKDEGPFGDHYGYYSLKHPFPYMKVTHLCHRKNPIFPATIVGKPRQEDFYIGEYLQKLLKPLFPLVMPTVKDLWSYAETGFHSLAAAVIQERYLKEGMVSAFRILGEGQLSLTKFLLLTDQNTPLQPFKPLLETILERFDPASDLYIFSKLSLDTLDYTGPKLNEGSRGVLIGTGEKKRSLPTHPDSLPSMIKHAQPFCPGCLVIESPMPPQDLIKQLASVSHWPLIILVDDVDKTLKNEETFLWTVFTRFQPALDIYTPTQTIHHHHISYTLPLLIDAQMKPSYPEVVETDPDTQQLVNKRWKSYFESSRFSTHSKGGLIDFF